MAIIVKSIYGLGKDFIEKPKTLNAFVAISLGNSFFSKNNLHEIIEWIQERAKNLAIVIADDPERYNYMVFKGLSEKEGLERAKRHGKKMRRVVRQIGDFDVLDWSNILANPRCKETLGTLTTLYNSDSLFREAVHQQIQANMKKRFVRLEEPEKNLPILAKYLLEELAVLFTLFEEMDYPVQIYPSEEMQIVKDIYEGKYPELKEKLGLSTKRGRVHYDIS